MYEKHIYGVDSLYMRKIISLRFSVLLDYPVNNISDTFSKSLNNFEYVFQMQDACVCQYNLVGFSSYCYMTLSSTAAFPHKTTCSKTNSGLCCTNE